MPTAGDGRARRGPVRPVEPHRAGARTVEGDACMSTGIHDHPGLGPAELIEVGDGVFAYIQPDGSWYINNTGFVTGRASAISIDACSTERRTRAYLERI